VIARPLAVREAGRVVDQIGVRRLTAHAEMLVYACDAVVKSGRRVADERHEIVIEIHLLDFLNLVAGQSNHDVQILVFASGRGHINHGARCAAATINKRARSDWRTHHLRALRKR